MDDVNDYQTNVNNLKEQEASLKRGLNIFKIEQPTSKELHQIEKELDHLHQIWQITKEWEELWDSWKTGQFVELVTEEMETTAQIQLKKLNKVIREVKVCICVDYATLWFLVKGFQGLFCKLSVYIEPAAVTITNDFLCQQSCKKGCYRATYTAN